MSEASNPSQGLGWRSAWSIAGKIAFEVQFRSALEMSQGALSRSIEKQIDKARSNTRYNKISICIFIAMLAVVHGFAIWATLNGVFGTPADIRWVSVALTISLFCLVALGFLAFWGIMVSTSFISSGAPAIGLYLPLSRSDAGKIALFSYIRLFDVQIISILVAFPISYFFATWSILGSLVSLGVFLITVGLAITLMLLLAIYFHTRIQSSGGSRLNSLIRFLFIILWVVAIMGITLGIQLISYLLPLIESLAFSLRPFWYLLVFGFPFSLGTVVVSATGIPGTPLFWGGIGMTLFYAFLAFLGIRWSLRFLVHIGEGGIVQGGPGILRPTSVKVSSVGAAILRKDIRIAFRTPGQAIMFFLPILMMIPLIFSFIFELGAIHVMDVLMFIAIPTTMLAFLSIFFLSLEARGMRYTLTLPIKTETILKSKARLITLMSLTIPLFVIGLSFYRPLTTPISYLIAISQIAVVYVSAYIALIFFTRVIGGGRLVGFEIGQHITQTILVGFASAIFAFIPLGFFGICWFIAALFTVPIEIAHLSGLAGLWLGILINFGLGNLLARGLLKD